LTVFARSKKYKSLILAGLWRGESKLQQKMKLIPKEGLIALNRKI